MNFKDLFNEKMIALFALVISSIFSFLTYRQSIKLNNKSILSNFYNEIFMEYLFEKIPIAKEKIEFSSNNKLIEFTDLSDYLDEMLMKCIYLKTTNTKVYVMLLKKIDELQKFIAKCANDNVQPNKQHRALKFINLCISDIYKIINKIYMS